MNGGVKPNESQFALRESASPGAVGRSERVDEECFGGMSRGLAHDIQNLLTPISTCLQIISVNPAKGAELVPLALRNLESLQAYVRHARGYGQHPAPVFQTVHFEFILTRALGLVEDRLKAKGLKTRLVAHGNVHLEADSVMLLRLVSNLLLNAIEASPSEGTILIEFDEVAGAGGGQAVRFEMSDAGTGLNPERLQSDSGISNECGAGTVDGQGQGLAICRRIVELHAGKIVTFAVEPTGTRVRVELPVSRKIRT